MMPMAAPGAADALGLGDALTGQTKAEIDARKKKNQIGAPGQQLAYGALEPNTMGAAAMALGLGMKR